jgi:NhaP-type Na+/H+ or K+/H+ antiporter
VLAAIAIGAALGWLAGRALVWAYAQPFSKRVSGLTVSVALALTSVACVHLIGSSGILAAFVAGLLFKRFLARAEDPHHERVQKAIGRFFDLPVLALLACPCHGGIGWPSTGRHGCSCSRSCCCADRQSGCCCAQCCLRSRTAAKRCSTAGSDRSAFYAAEAGHLTHIDLVWTVGSLGVFASIVMHGMSATPLIRRYRHLFAGQARSAETTGIRRDTA